MGSIYDAIVIGARCGGSPTATHVLHPPAVADLARWGLLERLEATGCPPIERYSFDFGPFTIAGTPRPSDAVSRAYAPRRTVLDKLLVDAAAEAGADLREAFAVEELLFEDDRVVGVRGRGKDGDTVTERARVVIGADGRHSLVAKAVDAERYDELPTLSAPYYAYWSGLPTDGFETTIRAEHGRGWAAIPTNDDLTCVVVGGPRANFDSYRKDVEGSYMRAFELVPEFARRIRGATRVSRLVGTGDLPNYFRKPYGPGWALVGDAGYHKDPITAFGIHDAFRCAGPAGDGAGRRPRRPPPVRRGDGRLSARPRRAGQADLRPHL